MRKLFTSSPGKILLGLCLVTAVALPLLFKKKTDDKSADTATVTMSHPAAPPISARLTANHIESFPMPNNSASADELLELARNGVARSPHDALVWAESCNDPQLRERLLFAVLQAWGEKEPRAAVDWALRENPDSRFIRMEAALKGAATQPEIALEIGHQLIARDPDTGSAYATALVGALSGVGEFQTALQLAIDGPADSRADWLANTFRRWGESQPGDAAKALQSIADKELHDAALQALVTGWAANNPADLASFAMSLSAPEERSRALDAALSEWCLRDPASLGEWLNSAPANPEMDNAVFWLITKTDSVNREPEVALSWVAGITDPSLRRDSLVHVMKEWIQSDSTSAWQYFKNISWLEQTDLQQIAKELQKSVDLTQATPDDSELGAVPSR